jgi:hypothetical protein
MSLAIRELAPELLEDYLAFFDIDAFADFPWWSGNPPGGEGVVGALERPADT